VEGCPMKINTARIVRLTLIGLLGGIVFITLKEIWESYGSYRELDLLRHYQDSHTLDFVGIITAFAFGIAIVIDLTEAFKSLLNRHEIYPLLWVLRYRMEKELLRSKALLDAGIITDEEYQKKVIVYRSYLK
jgi:hypothetical protein